MPDYLLQQGRRGYWPHLDLTERIHSAYAERHGLQYISHRGAVLPEFVGYWDSVPLMLDLVTREDTGFVAWLDADTLICDDADPREALGDYLVGMARHAGPPEHYNCGVLFVRACPQTRGWLQWVLDEAPGSFPWYQQTVMNRLLTDPQWDGRVLTLPNEWNSTVGQGHSPGCHIRAWHGTGTVPERVAMMRAEIERRGLWAS